MAFCQPTAFVFSPRLRHVFAETHRLTIEAEIACGCPSITYGASPQATEAPAFPDAGSCASLSEARLCRRVSQYFRIRSEAAVRA
jgi:hypothetical protein